MAVPARRARLLGLLFSLAAITGCFHYQEDVWVYDDHSGRVEGQIRVPTAVWDEALTTGFLKRGGLRSLCQGVAARVPGVELASFEEVATSEYYRANWAYTFTGPAALSKLLQVSADEALALVPETNGTGPRVAPAATVERLGRLTSIRRVLPGVPGVASDRVLRQALLDDTVEFRVHTPEPVVGPADLRSGGDGRTAVWEVPLVEVLGDGVDMRVSFRRPFPAGAVGGCVAALLLGIGGIWGFAYRHMMLPLRPVALVAAVSAEGGDASRDSFEDDGPAEYDEES